MFSPYVLVLIAGVASDAAMFPYTAINEANPPDMSGTSTGVVNFLNSPPALYWAGVCLVPMTAGGGAPDLTLTN